MFGRVRDCWLSPASLAWSKAEKKKSHRFLGGRESQKKTSGAGLQSLAVNYDLSEFL